MMEWVVSLTVCLCTHTHTHTRMHMHTYTHPHTHIHSHTHTHSHTLAYVPTHTHTHVTSLPSLVSSQGVWSGQRPHPPSAEPPPSRGAAHSSPWHLRNRSDLCWCGRHSRPRPSAADRALQHGGSPYQLPWRGGLCVPVAVCIRFDNHGSLMLTSKEYPEGIALRE